MTHRKTRAGNSARFGMNKVATLTEGNTCSSCGASERLRRRRKTSHRDQRRAHHGTTTDEHDTTPKVVLNKESRHRQPSDQRADADRQQIDVLDTELKQEDDEVVGHERDTLTLLQALDTGNDLRATKGLATEASAPTSRLRVGAFMRICLFPRCEYPRPGCIRSCLDE